MVRSTSEITPLLRKPTLHRVGSKRSLAISRRPSLHYLRQKLRRARVTLFRRSAPAPSGVDYLSTRLPAEVRIKIYSHLLQFDAPLRCDANVCRRARLRNLDILRVSRLVRREALFVLYELNTISVNRAAFCINTKSPSCSALNYDRIRNLYIKDLEPSQTCAPLISRSSWPNNDLPCVYCDKCILPLIRSLRDMPRLKEVLINYHNHASAICNLSTTLSRTWGRAADLRLTCTGVGKYVLAGPWFAHTTVKLHDVLLTETWTRILILPKLSFMTVNLRGFVRESRLGHRAFSAALDSRFGKKNVKVMVAKLLSLITLKDLGLMPQGMVAVWPEGLEKDFAVVDGCGREKFLHLFNMELQKACEKGVGFEPLAAQSGGELPW